MQTFTPPGKRPPYHHNLWAFSDLNIKQKQDRLCFCWCLAPGSSMKLQSFLCFLSLHFEQMGWSLNHPGKLSPYLAPPTSGTCSRSLLMWRRSTTSNRLLAKLISSDLHADRVPQADLPWDGQGPHRPRRRDRVFGRLRPPAQHRVLLRQHQHGGLSAALHAGRPGVRLAGQAGLVNASAA